MNKYMNINRIEFSITNSCTSKCRHCSVATSSRIKNSHINKEAALLVVSELADLYSIDSVMTFGGEPLLYADITCAIHKMATLKKIPKRQIITNGYFSKDTSKINMATKLLKESGVNSLLLSVDTFHKEYILLDNVYMFAKAVCNENIEGFKLHPAWVVSSENENKYNNDTIKCLEYFSDLKIPISSGNNIFPAGNAAIYLSEFYEKKPIDLNLKCGEAPYTGKLDDIESVFIDSTGDVMVCNFIIGNIYSESIVDIIERYDPYKNHMMSVIMNSGVSGLIDFAKTKNINIDLTKHYLSCSVVEF